MPEVDLDQLDGLIHGISTQEPHLRHPGQVQDAVNAVFSVEDGGARKRPGSRFGFVWTDLPTDRDIRIHLIDRRASNEIYLVGYGASTLKVRTATGTRCTVFQKSAPLAYLGTSVADKIRMATVADTTLITSQDVGVATKKSDDFRAARTLRTFEQAVSFTPSAGDIVQVTDSSNGVSPGHWLYDPGRQTYATLQLNDVALGWADPDQWRQLAVNPIGFRVFFSTVAVAIAGGTWTQATKTVTKVGAFTNYTHEANRYLNITGGTGFTGAAATHYLITSKVSNDAVTIEHPAPPADNVNLTATDIGISVPVSVAMTTENFADMHDVAAIIQREVRANGAPNACVCWTTKYPTSGYFTFTHPFGGASSNFPAAGAMRTGPAGSNDLTNAATEPFYSTGYIVTAGTGRNDLATAEPVTRWTRVAGPAQEQAEYDAEKMPCSLVRVHAGGVWSWVDMTTKLAPFAWYRLGELNGQTAYDELGRLHGTMPAGPARSFPGLIAEGDDGARVFNSNNKHLWLGQMGTLGSKLNRPISFECRLTSNHATKGALVACGRTSDGTTQSLHVWVNTTDGATDSQGRWWFRLSDRAGRKLTGNVAVNTGVTNNNPHSLAVAFDPAANKIYLWIDGTAVNVTVTEAQSPSDFTNTTADTAWTCFAWDPDGDRTATNNTYLRCTADEVVFHNALFTDEIAAARHGQLINAAYAHAPMFVLKETPWSPRPSGDRNSNSVPDQLAKGKAINDVAAFRDRLWLLCGDQVVSTQDGDYFNLWIDDPANVTDADPIIRTAPGDQVAQLDFATPVQRALILFSTTGKQFQLTAPEAFTPTTAVLDEGSRYQAVAGVRPCADNTRIYFAGGGDKSGHLIEYFYSDAEILLGGNIVSKHVPRLLPPTFRRLVAATGEANKVLALSLDGLVAYQYGYYFDKSGEKLQSAWGKWSFDAAWPVLDMACIGDTLYILSRGQGVNVVDTHSLTEPATEAGMPYLAHMDRVCTVNGTFGGVNTTWPLPGGLQDTTINQLVKANGAVVTVTSAAGVLTAAGNHAGAAVAGRKVSLSIELTRKFARNRLGQAILSAIVNIYSVVTSHLNTGAYDLVARMTLRNDRRRTMTPRPPYSAAGTLVESTGKFEAPLNGDAASCRFFIESDSPLPVCITGVEYLDAKRTRQ